MAINAPGAMPQPELGMPAETPETGERPSIFLSKADLGGMTMKQGDTLTLTVTDVDPETGDIQAELSDNSSTAGSFEEDFDKAVPEDTEDGY